MEDFAKGILYNLGYLSRDQADAANLESLKLMIKVRFYFITVMSQSLLEFQWQVRKGKISLPRLRFAQIIVCSLESLKMELLAGI